MKTVISWKEFQNILFADIRSAISAKAGSDMFRAASLWIMINSKFYNVTLLS